MNNIYSYFLGVAIGFFMGINYPSKSKNVSRSDRKKIERIIRLSTPMYGAGKEYDDLREYLLKKYGNI